MSEVLFRTWFANFVTQADANQAALNLTLPDVAELTTAQTDYADSVATYTAAHDAAKTSTINKNDAYRAALALVSRWGNQWQNDPNISAGLISDLGLTPHDTTPSQRPIYPVTDLAVTGNSVGTVKLKWNRNGNLPGCNFIVQSRPLGTSTWTYVTVTTTTRLALGGQPLTPTEFQVVTERRGIFSEPCDSANVYSTSGPSLTLLEEAA